MPILHEYPVRCTKDEWEAAHRDTQSVEYYGAVGDGETDDTAAIQACLDANNGYAEFDPTKTYVMENVSLPTLSPFRWLTIDGRGCTIKTTKGGFLHTAEDVCRNIRIRNFNFDATGSTGRWSLIGSYYTDGGTIQGQNRSWENVRISDIVAKNLPLDADWTATNACYAVAMTLTDNSASADAGLYGKDIIIERVRVEGGISAVSITGHRNSQLSGQPDIDFDDITIRDCYHDTGYTGSETWVSAGFMVGHRARVGRVLVDNCVSINSGDVGVEINNAIHGTVANCKTVNPASVGVLFRNVREVDADKQRLVVRDHGHIREFTSGTSVNGFSVGGGAIAAKCDYGGVGYDMGTVLIDGLRFADRTNGRAWCIRARSVNVDGDIDPTGPVSNVGDLKQLTVRNVDVDVEVTNTVTSALVPFLFRFDMNDGQHTIDNVHITVRNGSFALAGGSWNYYAFRLRAGTGSPLYVFNNVRLDYGLPDVTGALYFISRGTNVRMMYDASVRAHSAGEAVGAWGYTSAPTDGTWRKGDSVLNTLPDPAEYIGWVCTDTGNQTWKGFGAIEA